MDKHHRVVSMDGDLTLGRSSMSSMTSMSETNDAILSVNQSTRAWMWHKSSPSTVKRAHSEQTEGHHLWHPRPVNNTKRTSAPQVSTLIKTLTMSIVTAFLIEFILILLIMFYLICFYRVA